MSTTTIQITDDGPGIPDPELAALQAGEETQLVHASGVGLWLITWLCQLYDGDVRFETDPGTGTVVTLEFQRVTPVEHVAERAQSRLRFY